MKIFSSIASMVLAQYKLGLTSISSKPITTWSFRQMKHMLIGLQSAFLGRSTGSILEVSGVPLFNEFFGKIIPIEQSYKSRIDDRINLFNELLSALESGFSTQNLNYANLCLNNLLASFFFVDTFRAVKGQKSSDPVDQAILFMQKNINRNLKINDLSKHVNLSESHLSKIFRNKTGSSPLDYFINLKMQEAIRLLTNQSLKIKEVAYRLGYNDPYYFTRIFTKHIESSPASFVKVSKRTNNR